LAALPANALGRDTFALAFNVDFMFDFTLRSYMPLENRLDAAP
jgi:hypothetical protein